MRAFNNCHAELVSASLETLKQVQGDKRIALLNGLEDYIMPVFSTTYYNGAPFEAIYFDHSPNFG